MGSFHNYQENVHGKSTPIPFEKITYLPTYQQVPIEEPKNELSWFQQRALDLKITTMVQPTKPYWNTTMVTAWVAVIVGFFTIMGAIGGLYLYTDQKAEQRGVEKGRMAVEKEQMQKDIEDQRRQLRENEKLLRRALNLPDPSPTP